MNDSSDFADIDEHFCRIFSEQGPFSGIKYKNAPLFLALQNNVYDYYRHFIYDEDFKLSPFQSILSRLRIYGIDHKIKLLVNRLFQRKQHSSGGRIVFFADNFVPRILEDFLKVMAGIEQNKLAFYTTDYRAYKFMRKTLGNTRCEVVLLKGKSIRLVRSKDRKQFSKDSWTVLSRLITETFGGMARDVKRIAGSNLQTLAEYYDIFEGQLKDCRPRSIILGSDGFSVARIMCFAARSMNVSTYVLQHGLIDSQNGYLPLIADHIFAWSDNEKRYFESMGVSSERLIVAGAPRFDHDSARTALLPSRSIISRQLLFVISPGVPQDIYEQIDTIMEIGKALTTDYTIVVRPHPYYRELTNTYFDKVGRKDNIILDTKPFLTSVAESKMVIFGDISTAIFEAVAFTKNMYILMGKTTNKLDIYRFPKISPSFLIERLNAEIENIQEFNIYYQFSSNREVSFVNIKSANIIASHLN